MSPKSCLIPSEESRYLDHAFVAHGRVYETNAFSKRKNLHIPGD